MMCSLVEAFVGTDGDAAADEEDDDVLPLDLSDTPDQHLYPVEEEEEEEDRVEEADDDNSGRPPDPAAAAAAQSFPSRSSSVPQPALDGNNHNNNNNTNNHNNNNAAANNNENIGGGEVSATAIAAPPNALAPGSFAPPAYTEGGPDMFSYALPHNSSMEYLVPPDSRDSSRRRSCRHRSRSRPRSRLCPLFRFPRRFRRFWRLKRKERNIAAAATSLLVIAFLVSSLALPKWFHLRGGACKRHSLGAIDFFRLGVGDLAKDGPEAVHEPEEEATAKPASPINLIALHSTSRDDDDIVIWGDCVTSQILMLMRTVIVLVFGALSFTAAAFFLDAAGAQTPPYKFVRRHALGNIVSVLICVVVNGFAYWVSTLIRAQQTANKTLAGKKVEVNFDVSFYLVVGAGGCSVIATAANLLKQHPTEEEEQISRLIDWEENHNSNNNSSNNNNRNDNRNNNNNNDNSHDIGDDDDHDDHDRQENLLERRMRSRGDLSSLYDPHYGLSSYGDTLMSTYPRSAPSSSAPPNPPPGVVLPPPPPPGVVLPPPPPPPGAIPRSSRLLFSNVSPCSSNVMPPPYTP